MDRLESKKLALHQLKCLEHAISVHPECLINIINGACYTLEDLTDPDAQNCVPEIREFVLPLVEWTSKLQTTIFNYIRKLEADIALLK